MSIHLPTLHNRPPLLIKINRHPIPERKLQRRRNLRRLIRILRLTRQFPSIKHRLRKLLQIIPERLIIQLKRIRRRGRPDSEFIPHFYAIGRGVAVYDAVACGSADSGAAFEAVGEGAADVGCEDLAVGEFDYSPAVVAVAVFGEVAVDGLLAEGDYAVDLFLWVGET